MGLTACTLVGARAGRDDKAVAALSRNYPFVEWAALYKPGCSDEPYSDVQALERLLDLADRHGFFVALHLCGESVAQFIAGDAELRLLAHRFDRVQLNFNLNTNLVDLAGLSASIQHSRVPVITSHFAANDMVLTTIGCPRHSIIFDDSRGRGVTPSSWPDPIPGKVCGYAGGLKPETADAVLQDLQQVNQHRPFWIQAESGVTTNGVLDHTKAEAFLDACLPHWVLR